MPGYTTVGVSYYLPSSNTRIAHWAPDLKPTGRVHEETVVAAIQSEISQFRFHDVFLNIHE